MQGLSLSILHHQVHELRRVDRLEQLDHSIMVKSAQDSDLSDGLLFALRLLELGPVVLLNRHFLSTWLEDALFHNSVGSVANLLAKVVHIQVVAVGSREFLRVVSVVLPSSCGEIALNALVSTSVAPTEESKPVVLIGCSFLVSVEVLSVLF